MKAAKPGHFPQLRQITLSKLSELPKRPAGTGRWARRMSCAERRRYINCAKKRGKRNVGSCPRAAENQIHPVSALRIGKTSHPFWPECVRGIRFNVKRDEKRRPDWIRAPENSPGIGDCNDAYSGRSRPGINHHRENLNIEISDCNKSAPPYSDRRDNQCPTIRWHGIRKTRECARRRFACFPRLITPEKSNHLDQRRRRIR